MKKFIVKHFVKKQDKGLTPSSQNQPDQSQAGPSSVTETQGASLAKDVTRAVIKGTPYSGPPQESEDQEDTTPEQSQSIETRSTDLEPGSSSSRGGNTLPRSRQSRNKIKTQSHETEPSENYGGGKDLAKKLTRPLLSRGGLNFPLRKSHQKMKADREEKPKNKPEPKPDSQPESEHNDGAKGLLKKEPPDTRHLMVPIRLHYRTPGPGPLRIFDSKPVSTSSLAAFDDLKSKLRWQLKQYFATKGLRMGSMVLSVRSIGRSEQMASGTIVIQTNHRTGRGLDDFFKLERVREEILDCYVGWPLGVTWREHECLPLQPLPKPKKQTGVGL